MARSHRSPALCLLLISGLFGCRAAHSEQEVPPAMAASVPELPVGEDWRAVIRARDLARLDRIDGAWSTGLDEARRRFRTRIETEGALLEPDGALPRAAPPPGPYRCRMVRLGVAARRSALTVYPRYFCHVAAEGELLAFTKQTGSERPGGYFWSDSDQRMVFLGAMAQGNDAGPPAYGEDDGRDLVGIVERVGPFRYRIVFPWPQNGARIDLLELVPFVPQVE